MGEDTFLSFNSNDYLGLASDPRVCAAFEEGIQRYGVGGGASHLISGHFDSHHLLEERLAGFMSPHIYSPQAVFFSSGYLANLGVAQALADLGREDLAFFSDALNHASIIDAIRLTKAACHVYAHTDMLELEKLLAASKALRKVVITDGVFSMDGDIAPMEKLVSMCVAHSAVLVVDDAHGFGVLGANGRGILELFNLKSDPNQLPIIYIGTLGKAAGVSGAFVCAHTLISKWLVQRARTYIYTTAAPPAGAHALLTSLELIKGQAGLERRDSLRSNIVRFKECIKSVIELSKNLKNPWALLASDSAIQPLIIGSNEDALNASRGLEEYGIWVSAIRAPTVPLHTARLRITLSALHEKKDIEQLAQTLKEIVSGLLMMKKV